MKRRPCEIRVERCEAARGIEDEFGTDRALSYLVGAQIWNFLEAAEAAAEFRSEVPAFAAERRTLFERWQLAAFLETARQTEPFDPSISDEGEDPEVVAMERQGNIRRSANDLLLVGRAKEWLLESSEPRCCSRCSFAVS